MASGELVRLAGSTRARDVLARQWSAKQMPLTGPPGQDAGWTSVGSLYGPPGSPARVTRFINAYGGTEESVVWVFACASTIGEYLAGYEHDFVDPKSREPLASTPDDLVELMAEPNSEPTSYLDFANDVGLDLELVGNSYWLKDRQNALGQPLELLRLEPERTQIATDPQDRKIGYVFSVRGRQIPFGLDDVIQYRYRNPFSRHYGMGTVEGIIREIEGELSQTLHVSAFFNNGGVIAGILTAPEFLPEDQFQRLVRQTREMFGSPENAYRILIAEGTAGNSPDFKPVSAAPPALGVVDLRAISKDAILSGFGVPAPILGGILENANYKMEDSQSIMLRTMTPKAERFQQRTERDLTRLWDVGFHVKPETSDPQSVKNERAKNMVGAGASINDLRRTRGEAEIQEPYANLPLLPVNVVPWGGPVVPMPTPGAPSAADAPPIDYRDLTASAALVGPSLAALAASPRESRRNGDGERGPASDDDEEDHQGGEAARTVEVAPMPDGFEQRGRVKLGKAAPRVVRALAQGQASFAARAVIAMRQFARSVLGQQREHVLARLARFGTGSERRAVAGTLRDRKGRLTGEEMVERMRAEGWRAGSLPDRDVRQLRPEELWDKRLEDARLREAYLAAIDSLGPEAVSTASGLAGAGISWDLQNPHIDVARDRLADRVVGINETTRQQIAAQVEEGLKRGYSVTQIANGVPDETYRGVRGVFDASAARAETIARTETGYLFNAASVASYREAGVELVSVIDGEGDEGCAEAAGSTWTLDEAEANPLEHPNCVRAFVPLEGQSAADLAGPEAADVGEVSQDSLAALESASTDELAAAAREQAVLVEPSTTPTLEGIAGDVGGRLEGLQYKLKTAESMARKIRDDAVAAGVSEAQSASKIVDALRYTAILEPADYAVGSERMLAQLKAAGYDVERVKNYWTDGPYKGLNVVLRHPSGYRIELQFHTEESFAFKEEVGHPLYDRFRVEQDPSVRAELWAQMREGSNRLEHPPGVDRIGEQKAQLAGPAPAPQWEWSPGETRSSLDPVVTKRQAAWEESLTGAERDALYRFSTASTSLHSVNAALRADRGFREGELQIIRRMDAAIARAPAYDEPVTVFRGLDLEGRGMPPGEQLAGVSGVLRDKLVYESLADYVERRFPVGAVEEMPGYQSTSFGISPGLDASHSREAPGIMLEIRTRRGAYIGEHAGLPNPSDAVSEYPGEKELLLPRGAKFRVVGVDRRVAFNDEGEGRIVYRPVVQLELIDEPAAFETPDVSFHESPFAELAKARDESRLAWNFTPIEPDAYGGKAYLSEDGKVGYAVEHGYGNNIFNNSAVKGAGRAAMFDAIDNGVRVLDCYDGFLPRYYSKFGFVETGRIPFSDAQAPAGWDLAARDRPDVVFMAIPEERVALAREWAGTWGYERSEAYRESWDEQVEIARRRAGLSPRPLEAAPAPFPTERIDVTSGHELGEGMNLNKVYLVEHEGGDFVVKPEPIPLQLREAITPGKDLERERSAYVMADWLNRLGLPVRTPELRIGSVTRNAVEFDPEEGVSVETGDVEEARASVARYAEGEAFYDTPLDLSDLDVREVRVASLYDAIIGNTDRHPGNFLIPENSDQLTMIDHGLAFPERTTGLPENAQLFEQRVRVEGDGLRPEEEQVLRALLENRDKIEADLAAAGLPADAVEAMWARVAHMLKYGIASFGPG